MKNRNSLDKLAETSVANNEALRSAHKSRVKSASWFKIVLFAAPMIVVVAGVIWASSL
jgi:t-SNARE complex subunit (syntaxin)